MEVDVSSAEVRNHAPLLERHSESEQVLDGDHTVPQSGVQIISLWEQ